MIDRLSELNRGLESIRFRIGDFIHERGSLRVAASKVIAKVESALFPEPVQTLNSSHDWIRAELLILGYAAGMFGSIGVGVVAKEVGLQLNLLTFIPTFAATTFLGGSLGWRAGLRIP